MCLLYSPGASLQVWSVRHAVPAVVPPPGAPQPHTGGAVQRLRQAAQGKGVPGLAAQPVLTDLQPGWQDMQRTRLGCLAGCSVGERSLSGAASRTAWPPKLPLSKGSLAAALRAAQALPSGRRATLWNPKPAPPLWCHLPMARPPAPPPPLFNTHTHTLTHMAPPAGDAQHRGCRLQQGRAGGGDAGDLCQARVEGGHPDHLCGWVASGRPAALCGALSSRGWALGAGW